MRQACNERSSIGRCSVHDHGADGRQKTSTSTVIGGPLQQRQNHVPCRTRRRAAPGWLVTILLALAAAPAHGVENDYPTAARADYVIGCMAANGNTHEALLKCPCAIDTIAS